MVFSSTTFLFVFLPVVFVVNLLIRHKTALSNVFLLVASLLFYAWGEPVLVLLMMTEILVNWVAGRLISSGGTALRKTALVTAIVFDLGCLGYYKYSAFFASVINSVFHRDLFAIHEIALPIGISFFTFQAVSYVIDVYQGKTEASVSLINVALYISFFPQLIAGPIVKYRDINRQIENRIMGRQNIAMGIRRFIYGLSKKVLISNVLGLCVDTIYSYDITSVDGLAAWTGALAYTFQIYYDFSGYSDMAIGLGQMFGFDIPENFNYPYLSRSIGEFWRRWHISLGAWFKEYLYIPLGGNRKGKVRTYINLGIVFILTGLWHGADFSYILWGGYHGFLSIAERLGLEKILKKRRLLGYLYCFITVNFGWVLFRSPDTLYGLRYIARMIMPWRHTQASIPVWRYMDAKTVFIGICAVLGAGIIQNMIPGKVRERLKGSVPEALYLFAAMILCICAIASDTYNPFIYFQF